jgi:hypothetical protein
VTDEPDGALDDRRRTAMVDLQVDALQSRQRRPDRQDASDIRESPAVDRLVVVADEEDPVTGGRKEQRQAEL